MWVGSGGAHRERPQIDALPVSDLARGQAIGGQGAVLFVEGGEGSHRTGVFEEHQVIGGEVDALGEHLERPFVLGAHDPGLGGEAKSPLGVGEAVPLEQGDRRRGVAALQQLVDEPEHELGILRLAASAVAADGERQCKRESTGQRTADTESAAGHRPWTSFRTQSSKRTSAFLPPGTAMTNPTPNFLWSMMSSGLNKPCTV